MKNPSAVRSCGYLAATAVFLFFAVFFQASLNVGAEMVAAYYRSNLYFFIVFSVLVGTALYLWRMFAKQVPSLRSDILFMLVVGAGVLGAYIALFVRFGGLGDLLTKDTYTAVNWNSLLLFVLPAVCLLRAVICSVRARKIGGSVYRISFYGCIGIAVLMLIFVFCGLLLHIQPFDVGVANTVNGVESYV